MILFSPARKAEHRWGIKKGGVYIADSYSDQLNADGTVKRFNLAGREGVSDHLPLVMALEAISRD
jgi:hypothetical protein